jgi:hypothetical protein
MRRLSRDDFNHLSSGVTIMHIMLDLETWGKRPGCDLRSIGACVFAPETSLVHDESLGTIKPFYVATDNPEIPQSNSMMVPVFKYPLHRDPQTVYWWQDQSAEAQAVFTDPVDLADALTLFTGWLEATGAAGADLRLWCHGPSFNPPILAAAYDACGLPVPWHYRAPRDTRTLFDAAGITDHSAFLNRFAAGTYHHALDDAICQARAVCEAMAMITNGRMS